VPDRLLLEFVMDWRFANINRTSHLTYLLLLEVAVGCIERLGVHSSHNLVDHSLAPTVSANMISARILSTRTTALRSVVLRSLSSDCAPAQKLRCIFEEYRLKK
jgi:hypothetical protein